MEEEIKKQMLEALEPQKKLFEQMMNEIDGKVMDYESCKLLEEFFDQHNKQMIDSFVEALKKLKELQEKRIGEL